MAGLNLNLTVNGDTQLNRTLVGVSNRAKDFRPAWNVILDDLLDWEKRQFTSEGAFGSGGWPQLADSTKAKRVAMGFPEGPILDMTGDLKRSLTVKGASGQVSVIAPHQFAFGTTVAYAGFHQNGKGVPMRKPLELPESARRDITKTVQRFWVTGDAR